jgi:hypothetical protein
MDDFTRATLQSQLADISLKKSELTITAASEDRDFTASEQRKFNKFQAEAEALEDRLTRDATMQGELRKVPRSGAEGSEPPKGHSPLLVSDEHLRAHVAAIKGGTTFGTVEERTLVTVATDYGSPGAWGSGQIREPVTLRAFAGIPVGDLTGATAQMPSLTLPAGSAGVAESTDHGEFTATDVANLTTLRYGRWTEVTSFLNAFTDIAAINQAHAVGIARDLNLVDLTAIQTAAGTVTAFDATNLDRNVRQAILKVAAAAIADPSEVVIFGTSAALGVVTGYAPANGDDRGSVSTRVYGARVYVTEQATAGNVYMFAPSGFKVFTDTLGSASVLSPQNGSHKFGSWIHSTGPGLFIVGSAAGVDVVTP